MFTRRFIKLDEAHDVFFQRQLEDIDAVLYPDSVPDLESLTLVQEKPVPAGAATHTWRRYSSRGMAAIMNSYTTRSPGVMIAGSEETSKMRSIRNHVDFDIQEIREAAMAKVPLDTEKPAAARRAIDEMHDDIALIGDEDWQLIGLFTQPNAQLYTVPADGTAGATEWTAKTPDQIVRDVLGILDQIPTTTNEIEKPKRLLIPHTRFRLINSVRLNAQIETTILQHLQKVRPDVEIRGARKLDTIGDGGTMRMVAYDPNPAIVQRLMAIRFESFPPEWSELAYKIENHARSGGVICRRPMSMAYGDGI